MREHYDFRGAERGKFTVPRDQLRIPVYLDPEVSQGLRELLPTFEMGLEETVNELLRRELESLRQKTPKSTGT
ncbi:MAG: hypothetical protein WCG80_03725 [Spirochaetales bacterium]